MSEPYGVSGAGESRATRLDRVLTELVGQVPEIEAAAVVSFDGLPMASALPADMDEDRVAAMSAALLSLGERAAEGLGRGELSQVYVEGEHGTVFLISADDEAVLVAVAAREAKTGLMLFEVRRAAAAVAEVLRVEPATADAEPVGEWEALPELVPVGESSQLQPADESSHLQPVDESSHLQPVDESSHLQPVDGETSHLHPVTQNGWSDHQMGSLPATDWH